MTMIERVARALAKTQRGANWEYCRDEAVAAIEAMREPTRPMLRAAEWVTGTHGDKYRAMIDAALRDAP